jgi:diacylglycerol kinase family enzyme
VTPLVFVGVGERELTGDALGAPREDGRAGLHVVVVHGRRRARLLALALAAARGGARGAARMPEVDSFVVERCTIAIRGDAAWVATDGELTRMDAPLEYAVRRAALRVAAPPA